MLSSGLAYCHCFAREARFSSKQYRQKFTQLRQEIIKENQEELEKLLNLEGNDSDENDSKGDDKNGKKGDEHKDEKVKKDGDEHSDL